MYTRSTPLPVRCPQRRLVDRHGFTIMELLLVMSLLIMVGAISDPNFIGWAENQRLRAELDTERRTRSGRQLLVEPEAPPEMVAPQAFADPAALVRTASMSQAASYHVRLPPIVISGHLCSLTKPVAQPPPAPPSSARAAPAPAQGSFTAGEDYWAVPDDAPQPTPPADRSQRYLSP